MLIEAPNTRKGIGAHKYKRQCVICESPLAFSNNLTYRHFFCKLCYHNFREFVERALRFERAVDVEWIVNTLRSIDKG